MILDNNYMVKQILSPEECSQVVEAGVKHLQQAQTFKSSIGEKDPHRNSEVAWFTDPSFVQRISPVIQELNNVAGWAYEVDEVENIQFTKYTKVNNTGAVHKSTWNSTRVCEFYETKTTRRVIFFNVKTYEQCPFKV